MSTTESGVTSSGSHRIEFLDSARGIAAWIVLVYHAIQFFNMSIAQINPQLLILLKVAFNGTQAVSFFFVLSGFVLTASLKDLKGNFNFLNYVVRRVFRIYPLYLFAVIVAFFLTPSATPYLLIQEAIITTTHHDMLPPGWTMGIEVVLSLLVPVLVIVLRDRKMFYVLLGVSIVGYNYMSPFVFHFMLGALIYDLYRSGYNPEWLFKKATLVILIPVCILLYSMREGIALFPHLHALINAAEEVISMGPDISFFYFSGFASAVFIFIMLFSTSVQKVLNNRFFAFVGKISFSLYLLHWLFIKAIDYGPLKSYIPAHLSSLPILAVCLSVVTMLASYLTYRFIELPFMALGRKIDFRDRLN